MNKEIFFNEDLTILVGINGAGKTSILNVINWLLKPNVANLCLTYFDEIVFGFKYKNLGYEIIAKHNHNKNSFVYKLESDGKESFPALEVNIRENLNDVSDDFALKAQLLNKYATLSPEKSEMKTWTFIDNLPKPTIIGLDRQLYTEESDRVYIDESSQTKSKKSSFRSQLTPLDRVKIFVNKEYRKQTNNVFQLTEHLNNHLLLYAFEGNLSLDQISKEPINVISLEVIDRAYDRVKRYFDQFQDKGITSVDINKINSFFEHLKSITEKMSGKRNQINNILYQLNAHQFNKINELLIDFENFDKEQESIMYDINKFLQFTNAFFKDSYKSLLFRQDTSELCFNILDKDGTVVNKYKDLNYLSSGEQQILILFAYITFNTSKGGIFIIDEPELSLHIKWQELFLDKFERLIPSGVQVVIATHSPIIVGKQKNKAIVLYSSN
jgi:predicted ATPase